jgi:hypothetical protein
MKLAVIAFILAIVFQYAQAQSVDLSFTGTVDGRIGDTIDITFNVSDLTGLQIFSYFFSLEFDPNIYSFSDTNNNVPNITRGTVGQGFLFTSAIINGNQLRVAIAGTRPIQGGGSLFTLRGTKLSSNNYFGSLKVTAFDLDEYNYTINPSLPWILPIPTSVNSIELPKSIKVNSPYPNPFNNQITIPIQLEFSGELRIEVVNNQGVLIKTINYGLMNEGNHFKNLSFSSLATGMYLIIVNFNQNIVDTKKVVLLR